MVSDAKQVQAVFLKALEVPTLQRATFLDHECAADADLRRRVAALLDAHEQSGSFLAHPAAVLGVVPPEDPGDTLYGDSAHPTSSEGPTHRRIGPYVLVQKLGEGGMGSVWVGEQTEPVKRRVAVKLIKPGLASARVLQRFEAERQALALMDHPNIAKVLDAGTDASLPYVVMELIAGVPITRHCDEQRLSVRQRLELFISVCQAIQHAHQKGIIHRDVKPSNVLVSVHDGKPVPKVIDFGIAKAIGPLLTEESLHTEVGQVLGSWEYMSPEQADGSAEGIDTRADVYALGVLLYELLTGQTPLNRDRLRGVSFVEILRRIREEEPAKPGARLMESSTHLAVVAAQRRATPAQLLREVSGDLECIVLKCLDKDRGRRYETANALVRDVERHLNDEPVEASPPSRGYRLRKFIRRNRGAVIAASLVLASLVAGMVGTTWGLLRAAERAEGEREAKDREFEQRQAAEANERKATEEKRIAQAVRDFLQTKLLGQADLRMQANALLQRGGLAKDADRNVTVRELLDRAAVELSPAKIEVNFPNQPRLQVELLNTVGNAYLGVGEPAKAVAFLRRADSLARQHFPPDHPTTLATIHYLAKAYLAAGKVKEALALFEQVYQTNVKHLGADHLDTLANQNALAAAHYSAGNFPTAIRLFEQVKEGRVKQLGPDHPATLITLNCLASAYCDAGRVKEAIPIYQQVRLAQEKKPGPDHPDTLLTLNNLALAYVNTGRVKDAIPIYRQVWRVQEKILGEDHLDTLTTLNNLADAHRITGDPSRAISLFDQVRAGRVKKLGPDHPHTLVTLSNLAAAYQAARNLPEAIRLYEEVKAAWTLQQADHPQALVLLHNLAAAYQDAGRLPEAIRLFERAKVESEKKLGADHPNAAAMLNSLVRAYVKAGQSAEATELIRDRLTRARKGLPAGSPQLAGVLAMTGSQLVELKRFADAEPCLREAVAIRREKEPDAWATYATQSLLGGCLVAQKKFAEAEPLLLEAHEGIKQRPARADQIRAREINLTAAAQRLVQLYETWGKPAEAAKWREPNAPRE